MADGNIRQADVTYWTPTVIAQEAINYLKEYAVMPALVSKDIGSEFSKYGATLQIPKYGDLEVQDKDAATDFAVTRPSEDKVDITLDKHKVVAFEVEDIAEAMTKGSVIPGYAEQGLMLMADQVDSDLLALITSVTDQVGTAGTDITADMIADAREELVKNKVPKFMPKYMVLGPKDITALLKTEKFTSSAWIDDQGAAMKEAYLGKRYGMEIFEDTQMPTSGSSPVSTHNVGFTRDAFVLAMRPLKMPKKGVISSAVVTDPETGIAVRVIHSFDHKALAEIVSIDILYGVGIKRNEFAVEVLT